jgi:uncharacterized protein YciI
VSYFVCKLIPRRPTFGAGDMTESEATILGDHSTYWTKQLADGVAIVFGPVIDPAGNWGLAVIEADTETDVFALRDADPAITSGLATVEIYPMPVAAARQRPPRT